MPKVKLPRKSTSIDMTAMCDVSFLLLTFFMLTSKFRPPEVVPIDVPNSRSQIKLDKTMVISVDREGAAYFSISQELREKTLMNILANRPDIKLTRDQINGFKAIDMFGFSLAEMKGVLDLNAEEYKQYKPKGIPMDSLNNELSMWILAGRYADIEFNNPTMANQLKISVKGDKNSNIKAIKQVIYSLTEKANVHTFNLITTLSGSSQKVVKKEDEEEKK